MLKRVLRLIVGILLALAAVRLLLLGALLFGIRSVLADLAGAFQAPLITTVAGILFLLFVPRALWGRWGRILLIVLIVMTAARGVALWVTHLLQAHAEFGSPKGWHAGASLPCRLAHGHPGNHEVFQPSQNRGFPGGQAATHVLFRRKRSSAHSIRGAWSL